MASLHRHAAALDPLSRRRFLLGAAQAALGIGVLPGLAGLIGSSTAVASEPIGLGLRRPAKACIHLSMVGGMSHLDTFDPKPGHEHAGPLSAIGTTVDGIQLGELLPLTAKQMRHLAVVRSMTSNQGAHEQGQYFMRTSQVMRGTIRHPALGSWASHLLGPSNPTLPPFVSIGGPSDHPRAGFMESRFGPLPIGSPTQGLPNSGRPDGVTKEAYQHRLELLRAFNKPFQQAHDQRDVRAYRDLYDEAVSLMASRDLAAFDLNREPEAMRTAYGDGAFGQGCLLARRLVEEDVRFVEVHLGGWDTHDDNFDRLGELCQQLDRGLSTLISDLAARGLLDETLVVLATEFGRTPSINQNQGRDHYPKAFSGVLAGGGIRGGQAWGSTDAGGLQVATDPVQIPDFNATIAQALGIDLQQVVTSPSGRPFTVADKGRPLMKLFA